MVIKIFAISIAVLVVMIALLLMSAPAMRARLSYLQEELSKLTFCAGSETSYQQKVLDNKIDESLHNLMGPFSQRKRWEAGKLARETRRFLISQVPCFGEREEIPAEETRYADSSKCRICNESCIFHEIF